MTNNIIGSVLFTPQEPVIGQSVLVQVVSPKNAPYNNHQQEHISINGVTGSKQYLQFKKPGRHKIKIFASNTNQKEISDVDITIYQSDIKYPILRASNSKYDEYSVIFSLIEELPKMNLNNYSNKVQDKTIKEINYLRDQLSTVGHLAEEVDEGICAVGTLSSDESFQKLSLALKHKSKLLIDLGKNMDSSAKKIEYFSILSENQNSRASRSPSARSLSSSTIVNKLRSRWKVYNHDRSSTSIISNKEKVQLKSNKPLIDNGYLWEFGDGTWERTQNPYVTHSFEESLDPEQIYNYFDISVTDGWNGVTVKRTLTILNTYQLGRQHGIIYPKVLYDFTAKRIDDKYVSNIVIKNVEDFPLNLDRRRVIVMSSKPDQNIKPLSIEPVSITIPAKGSKNINLEVSANKIPDDSPGFSFHYSGQLFHGSMKIRVSAYFEIPEHERSIVFPIKEYVATDIRPLIPEDPRNNSDIYSIDLIEHIVDLSSCTWVSENYQQMIDMNQNIPSAFANAGKGQ